MAGVKLIFAVIETMAKKPVEERVQCPVCESEKEPNAWICPACFKTYGNGLVLDVQKAVKKAVNKIPDEVWQKILKAVRVIFSTPNNNSEEKEAFTDEDLVKVLKKQVVDFQKVPDGTIFVALATIRKDMEREVVQEARWQIALQAVEKEFPPDQRIDVGYFVHHSVKFKGNGNGSSRFITQAMMKAACVDVIRERKRAERSQITAAFVNSRLEEIGFVP